MWEVKRFSLSWPLVPRGGKSATFPFKLFCFPSFSLSLSLFLIPFIYGALDSILI